MFFRCLGALEFNKHEHAMCVFVIGRFDLHLRSFFWIFGLESFAVIYCLGRFFETFHLESFAWDHTLAIFRLGSFAGIFRLGSFAAILRSGSFAAILRLKSFAWRSPLKGGLDGHAFNASPPLTIGRNALP